MDLISLYEAVLRALNITPTREGLLTLNLDEVEIPAVIDDKRLALPTRDLLRSGAWEGLMAFHPLSENLLRGESPVVRMLSRACTLRISSILTDLLMQFALLGRDTGRHKTIPPKAADVLSAMPGIDDKFVDTLKKILAKQDPYGAHRLISLYIKRGGVYEGQKAARLAVVNFPIMEAIDREDDTIFDVRVRKKDREILAGLFKYILPDCEDWEAYSAPSASMSAPYFDALMRAFAKVADRTNEVVKLHWKMLEQHYGDPNGLLVELDWLPEFDDLSRYEGQIPSLAGNEGEISAGEEPTPTKVSAPVTGAAAGVFKVAAPAAVPAKPSITKMAEDDRPPWREDDKPATPASPFRTDGIAEALRQPSGPFKATPTPAGFGAADPNKFADRQPSKSGKDEYAEWKAKQQRTNYGAQAPAVHPSYAAAYPQPNYAVNPANAPTWAAGPAPVAPGEYAGRHRGVQVGNYGYGAGRGANVPVWMAPVQAPVGYGYPPAQAAPYGAPAPMPGYNAYGPAGGNPL